MGAPRLSIFLEVLNIFKMYFFSLKKLRGHKICLGNLNVLSFFKGWFEKMITSTQSRFFVTEIP